MKPKEECGKEDLSLSSRKGGAGDTFGYYYS
jgi:hypothetical protein